MIKERMIPFSNGSQYLDWRVRNCDKCKNMDNINWESSCDIEKALSYACIADGRIDNDLAVRMAADKNRLSLTWDCPERINK